MSSKSKLKESLSYLSKASPLAVYAEPEGHVKEIVDYIYVSTAIEKDYLRTLEKYSTNKGIVFLCGSSGDGKSAIIARNRARFDSSFDVHIDATHSFRADQTAIEALDQVFKDYLSGEKSLVVGINMGIMLNYAREGCDECLEVKSAIKSYVDFKLNSENAVFINFEDYPKFKMEGETICSEFVSKILHRVTEKIDENPFYSNYLKDLNSGVFLPEHKNFQLLSLGCIQSSIVELIVTAHLKYDQFLTARGILDFIYVLVTGKNLLVDQLFEECSNPIIANIQKEDPALLRTKRLDIFILERANKKSDAALESFIQEFDGQFDQPVLDQCNPHSLVRLFYLIRDLELTNSYQKAFLEDFNDHSTLEFIKLVRAHQDFSRETKPIIRAFYKLLKKAMFSYANKYTPSLSKSELMQIDSVNGWGVCAEVEISPNFKIIEEKQSNDLNSFQCCLKINEVSILPVKISLGLYEMILSINNGYRPNKHDRNTIVLFEELLSRISNSVVTSTKVIFVKDGELYTFKDKDDEIEVLKDAN
jgi:DNA phosphorothioation-dependent restriction protein DptF